MWFWKQKQAEANFVATDNAGWDIKERCARNAVRNDRGQFVSSKGNADWKRLLLALSYGEKITPREMSDLYGWQADRTLRDKGPAKRMLDAHGIPVRTTELPNGEKLKWIDYAHQEKLRELVGGLIDKKV